MLLRRLEIKNVRRIRQGVIDFHGPGLQIIKGENQAGKTTIAQSIALTLEGPKAAIPGMITRGEEQAEIIAYLEGEQELKIRTVINGSVKQTVSQKGESGRYASVSGGVRWFLDSIRSGLESPWAMRGMRDLEIIELLKAKTGVSQKIAGLDEAVKAKETERTETGRDKKKIGELTRLPETKHPDPIDQIKKEREQAAGFMKFRRGLFERAGNIIREKSAVIDDLETLKLFGKEVEELAAEVETKLAETRNYSQSDIDALDKEIADWYESEEKAKAYDAYLLKKQELDRLTARYDTLTEEIETLREQRKKTLAGMSLGVKGLEIGEDNLLYHNGVVRGITETNRTGNWSTAESVKVFFSIGARFSGDLKVLIVDNAESLDEKTAKAISDWAETARFLVILLKVAALPEDLEEGIIYLKEGEVLTK
ncbi:MAG: AAA family ATPase [Treponema sp.]|jgi:hypothetical protein|nr:AAA family ATPase [Treponema sp.]